MSYQLHNYSVSLFLSCQPNSWERDKTTSGPASTGPDADGPEAGSAAVGPAAKRAAGQTLPERQVCSASI